MNHESVQQPNWMKNEKIAHLYPLGTFSAFCYMLIVFLGGYNSKTTYDIKLKFSAFLSCVEVTNCVKFQIPRYKDFKVGIFRISPITRGNLTAGRNKPVFHHVIPIILNSRFFYHYANMAIFHGCKNDNFQMKIFDIFLIFAQNIDCGYM